MTVSAISTSRVQSAIALASSKTGVDFDYLMGQAKLESGLNANARAGTSSASGLYQFIEQSWLAVVKKHGAEHGMGWAADSIGRTAGGRYTVSDSATRQAILGLRNDPTAASLMAAEHASDNGEALAASLGRPANGTDLYMAHFLGLGGARKFLSTMASNPDASGAALFPAAAAANRNIFYSASGAPRSLSAIYEKFADKLGNAGAAGNGGNISPVGFAAQALSLDGSTVVTGAGESAHDALAWATSTIAKYRTGGGDAATAAANLQSASVLRPTPDTARLAYMMLASMGA